MIGSGHRPVPLGLEAAPLWGGFLVCTRNHRAAITYLSRPIAIGIQEK
jgi:hypothetical protein